MMYYIKGVPGRGDEVINQLLNVGAKNPYSLEGNLARNYYYVSGNGDIETVAAGGPEFETVVDLLTAYGTELKLPEFVYPKTLSDLIDMEEYNDPRYKLAIVDKKNQDKLCYWDWAVDYHDAVDLIKFYSLMQIARVYNKEDELDWIPDFTDYLEVKYAIVFDNEAPKIKEVRTESHPLVFKSYDIAETFLRNNRSIIEDCIAYI